MRGFQTRSLLVEITHLREINAKCPGQKWPHRPKLSQRLIRAAIGGKQLPDDKPRLEDVPRPSAITRDVSVQHVKAQLCERFARLAAFGVCMASLVGALQNIGVVRRAKS